MARHCLNRAGNHHGCPVNVRDVGRSMDSIAHGEEPSIPVWSTGTQSLTRPTPFCPVSAQMPPPASPTPLESFLTACPSVSTCHHLEFSCVCTQLSGLSGFSLHKGMSQCPEQCSQHRVGLSEHLLTKCVTEAAARVCRRSSHTCRSPPRPADLGLA